MGARHGSVRESGQSRGSQEGEAGRGRIRIGRADGEAQRKEKRAQSGMTNT